VASNAVDIGESFDGNSRWGQHARVSWITDPAEWSLRAGLGLSWILYTDDHDVGLDAGPSILVAIARRLYAKDRAFIGLQLGLQLTWMVADNVAGHDRWMGAAVLSFAFERWPRGQLGDGEQGSE